MPFPSGPHVSGSRPRIRTGIHLNLIQIGMPIPFRRPWRPWEDSNPQRPWVGTRGSIRLSYRDVVPQAGLEPASAAYLALTGYKPAALPLSYWGGAEGGGGGLAGWGSILPGPGGPGYWLHAWTSTIPPAAIRAGGGHAGGTRTRMTRVATSYLAISDTACAGRPGTNRTPIRSFGDCCLAFGPPAWCVARRRGFEPRS